MQAKKAGGCSSAGQSVRLSRGRSRVRVPPSPPTSLPQAGISSPGLSIQETGMSFRAFAAEDRRGSGARTARGGQELPLPPMFHSTPERAPARGRSTRAPASPRRLTPTPLPVGDGSLRDLDSRFAEFCDHAKLVRGHSAATLHGYRDAYRSFRRFLLLAPADLGERFFRIEDWVRWNRQRGLGPVTTNTYWRQLRSFFTDLEARDGIPTPFSGLRPPVLPTRVPKALSPAECRRLLLTAEGLTWPTNFQRWRAVAIVATFLYSGLRRGELLRLTCADVNLAEGTILVRSGKGRGGGKDRTTYVAPDLREALARYLTERGRVRIDGPGFFCARSGLPLSLSTLRRIVERVRRASGVRFSIHGLRHSFVTMLLRSGVPIHVARDLAGHSNITTTAGYLRVFDEDKRREIRKVSFR